MGGNPQKQYGTCYVVDVAISKRAVGTGYCTDANKQEMVTYVTTKIRRTVESCFQACKSVQPNCIGFNSGPKQTAHSCILFLKDRTSMTSNEALPGGKNEWHRVVQPNSNVNKWGPPAQGNPQKQYGTCYVVEVAISKRAVGTGYCTDANKQ